MNRSVNKAVDAPLPLAIISFQFIYGNSVQMKQKQTGRELAVGTHVCIKERKRERASDSDVGGGVKHTGSITCPKLDITKLHSPLK